MACNGAVDGRPRVALIGEFVKHSWFIGTFVGATIFASMVVPPPITSQTTQNAQPHGPYGVIGIMRAIDEGHSVDLEAGYVRHLEWHAKSRIHSTGTAIQSRHPLNDSGGSFTRPSDTPLLN